MMSMVDKEVPLGDIATDYHILSEGEMQWAGQFFICA